MKFAPVDDMPVMQTIPANRKEDQTGTLYLDVKELKNVKKNPVV